MGITAAQVKTLREKSGAGMMDCKRALLETEGDEAAALTLLREQGAMKAEKRQGKTALEGVVVVVSGDLGKTILELNCETDFVARTDEFKAAAETLAELVNQLDDPPADADALMKISTDGPSVEERVTAISAQIGEHVAIGQVVSCPQTDGNLLAHYIHPGDQLAVVVGLSGDNNDDAVEELGKNVAMHVAAMNPDALSQNDMDPALVASEREIYKKQALDDGKPEKIIDRIVDGRIKKFFQERCLVEQDYVRDTDITIGELVAAVAKGTGSTVAISGVTRVKVGER